MVAVFSLAGGVGKTCLVATLGRALAALGEHVLLADTAVCGPCRFISVPASLSLAWFGPFLLQALERGRARTGLEPWSRNAIPEMGRMSTTRCWES